MTCQEISEFLMDYTNGELPLAVRSAFEQHLQECPQCVAYLKSYEDTVKLTRSLSNRESRSAQAIVPTGLIKAILQARKTQTD